LADCDFNRAALLQLTHQVPHEHADTRTGLSLIASGRP
jgi:hypothetical protein